MDERGGRQRRVQVGSRREDVSKILLEELDLRAGVPFAMGSDAVFTMFGQNTRELGWYVKIGMTPAQALATATTNGALLLGKEKELGAVAPGYLADLVAVEGDPLVDINVVLNNVKWVMKSGDVVVDKTESVAAR